MRIKEKKKAEFQPVFTVNKSIFFCIWFVFFVLFFVFCLPKMQYQSSRYWNKPENQQLYSCPRVPPQLLGPFKPDTAPETLETLDIRFENLLEVGGYSKPEDCIARSRVAIVITCRGPEYEKNALILLKNLHRMLRRQQLEYQIFVIFQTPGFRFNKGALFNVGVVEALKQQQQFDCFVFHDADILPMDDRNLYDCPRVNPRHLAAAVDTNEFK